MPKSEVDYLKFPDALGFKFNYLADDHQIGDCPFCGGQNKFYFNVGNGLWDCKAGECDFFGIGGNTVTMMRAVHEVSLSMTTQDDYARLSADRDLPIGILKREELALLQFPFTEVHKEIWLIPVKNHEANLCNFIRYTPGGKCQNMPAPCIAHLVGSEAFADPRNLGKPRIVTEGPWDRMALLHCLLTMNDDRYIVVATPGAGTFKEKWAKHFGMADAWVAYDNDVAGEKGIERVRKVLSKRSKHYPMVKSLSMLRWPPATPEKYDLRDLFTAEKNNPSPTEAELEIGTPEARIIRFIEDSRVDVPLNAGSPSEAMQEFRKDDDELEPLPCDDFEFLSQECSKHLYWTQNLKDVMLILTATNLSTRIVDNPLWLYVVGPPSSGKTTLLELCSADKKHGYATSRMTGIHSGYKENPDDKDDNSMVPRIKDKNLYIKDGTLLLGMAAATRTGILGELRDLYDGSSRSDYRNKVSHNYPSTNFTVTIAITDEIRKYTRNETALGERFLMVEIWDSGSEDHVIRAVRNQISGFKFNLEAIHKNSTAEVEEAALIRPYHHGKMLELKRFTIGFLHHLHEVAIYRPMPIIPDWFEKRMAALASVVAIVRTTVPRDRNSGNDPILYPTSESPMRVASQLTKMAISASFVLNRPEIDDEIYRIAIRLAHDTSHGWALLVAQNLAESSHPLTSGVISERLGLSVKTVERRLYDLMLLGAARKILLTSNEDNPVNGNETYGWKLSNRFQETWETAFGNFDLGSLSELIRIKPPAKTAGPKPQVTLEAGGRHCLGCE